ncbi:MAG: sigma-70 family RNA polymerase sigma factor [Bacteroidota bacterium]
MKSFDKRTYKLFFEAHYQGLKRFIYYKTGDMDVAQDLTQEAFIKVWEKRAEIEIGTAKSYLFTIGSNLAINHGKHEQVKLNYKHTMKPSDGATSESPEDLLRLKEFDELLKNALARLPDPYRETFLMHRVDKLKHKEIAERLNMSEKGVQKRVRKALELLNDMLQYPL